MPKSKFRLVPSLKLPRTLQSRYANSTWSVHYRHQNGIVWRIMDGQKVSVFLKLTRPNWYPGVIRETERLRWARAYLPVPDVLDCGTYGDVDWMLTEGLPGVDATDAELMSKPKELVPKLAEGLRFFHTAPASDCPFDFKLDASLEHVRHRIRQGLVDPEADFHPEHRHLTADSALLELERLRPKSEDLVVCHGDYCLPNVLLVDGAITGFVDLGELGVADRWWDLAVASWSVTWNLGEGWEDMFLSAYGVEPDLERVQFYRLLYDLVS